MKALVLIIFLLAAVGIGYPLINEDTTNLCSALERHLVNTHSKKNDVAALIALKSLQSLSDGTFMRALVKQHNPNMPADISCGFGYWRVLLDADNASSMLDDLLRSRTSQ